MTIDHTSQLNQLSTTGIWCAALTPQQPDRSIDTTRFADHIRHLLGVGCHGIAVFGTTGEANSFTVAERKRGLDALLETGVDPSQLMAGTGCCALPDTIELCRHALSVGCSRLLMLPPFYYKNLDNAGLIGAYASVIEALADDRAQLFIYHFPAMSGVPVPVEVITDLVERFPGTVAGVKDSSGDPENLHALLNALPNLAIFPGSEALLIKGLAHGAAGCISATANANPAGIRRVFDAWTADEDVEQVEAQAIAVREIFQQLPLVAALKQYCAWIDDEPGWRTTRPPMQFLSPAQASWLREQLSACDMPGVSTSPPGRELSRRPKPS
ncbi:MAG TPA: dihydrodipicolinate synthase family protein [Arenicellales bacterium]|nr:dihydrodipicolinate synthase family protein [Arenicellales bacterium]